MKTAARVAFFLVLVVYAPRLGAAQPSADCDQMRGKVAQLEQLDINAMSPSIQRLFKESLLKLYTQFGQCLRRDIAATAAMQSAFAGTSAAAGVEDKLRALNKERSDLEAKITLLRTALNLDGGASSEAEDAQPARPASDVGASAVSPERPRPSAALVTDTTAATDAATTSAPTAAPTPSCDPSAAYDDAPGILKDIAEKAAADVVRTGDADRAIFPGPQMVLYAVFDSASPNSSEMVRSLEAYQYLGETARTDKQLGSSAKSEGAVSAIEKPGFAQLLGFAIEHGGIVKENDGTNLTLSTSLYPLYLITGEDTAETYDRAGFLNRVAVSATFAVENKDDELANARRNNLSEWSVKTRLFGDRSTRSASFQKFWDEEIRPLIRARLQTLGTSINELSEKIDEYDTLEGDALDPLPDLVTARMLCPDYVAATEEGKKKIIGDLILGQLRTKVYDPVKSGRVVISQDEVARIEGEFLPDLKNALDNLVLGRGLLEERIDDLKKGPLGTLAYTNHRTPAGSDYSEAKFLFEQDKSFMRPLKLNANFGLTFYHHPDPALQQQTLRDVSAALSFEGTARSPFTTAEDMSKITYSFVGRYERLLENRRRPNRKPDIATAQFVVEVPFVMGLSLPFSLTYANATEEERKRNVRFNFGMRLDTDKLFALLVGPLQP